jgi:hypothetical protein
MFFPNSSSAQVVTNPPCDNPREVVQRQVEAFNRHDVDAFVATYSANIELRYLRPDTLVVRDSAALRKRYEFLRQAPAEFGVDVTERIVTGCFVIDHERFRPVPGKPASDAGVAVYLVEGRLIRRVSFATP